MSDEIRFLPRIAPNIHAEDLALIARLRAHIKELEFANAQKGEPLDSDHEAYLLNEERKRIWEAMRPHWHGDMGPAFVYLKDIQPIFQPEASAE